MNITSEELLKEARALEPQLQQWRRTLHRHPEVGFDLPHTKELVKKALTEMGYEPRDCGKAGVIALAGGKKPGKTILLLSISTNDALGMNMKNIGLLLNAKHVFFVPFGQDNAQKKPNSMVAHTGLLVPAAEAALEGKQYQPIIQ